MLIEWRNHRFLSVSLPSPLGHIPAYNAWYSLPPLILFYSVMQFAPEVPLYLQVAEKCKGYLGWSYRNTLHQSLQKTADDDTVTDKLSSLISSLLIGSTLRSLVCLLQCGDIFVGDLERK